MLCLLFALSCLLATSAAGRLSQQYLPPRPGAAAPSNQYLAPHASNLHYHGVSGQGHARNSAPHGAAGGFGAGAPAAAAPAYHGGQRSAGAQIPILRNEYQNDANGNYNFGFDTGNGIHRDETGEFKGGWPHGSLGVTGSYSYTGDDGKQYTVNYKADKNGFHAEGAHLPTPPPVPAEHQQHHGAAATNYGGVGSYGGHGSHGGSAGGHGSHGGSAGGSGAYHAAASNIQAPAARYLPPGGGYNYRHRRHY